MQNAIIKGIGNSRYLKTVGEALSLYPTYEDFLQAMIEGTFPVDFNGINKDGWTQQGTPLNKANLLSDTVISTLGLSTGVNSTPNDAFGVLANIGNVHVWRKTVVTEEEIPAGYTLGPVESNKVLAQSSSNWGNSYAAFTVASSITVDDGGNVTMNDTSGVEIWQGYFDPNKGEDNLLGKFIQFSHVSADHISSDLETGVYFIPSNAAFIRDHSSAPFYTKISACQKVNAYPLTPAGTHITYLTSVNRNAYQDGTDGSEKPAGYTLGDEVTECTSLTNRNSEHDNSRWFYSDQVDVSSDGKVSLRDSNEVSFNAEQSNAVNMAKYLLGKFIMTDFSNTDFSANTVYFIPNDASVLREPSGTRYVYTSKYQTVTGYPAIPAGTTIDYLGVLGDKTRIETGSYVGTGTYGESNPNSLTFQFQPKFVVICKELAEANFVVLPYGVKSFITYVGGASDNSSVFTWGEKSLTWYSVRGDTPQLNRAKANYRYVAFG